jgi:hypothetical protein
MQKEVFSGIAAHNKRVMDCFDKWLVDRKK